MRKKYAGFDTATGEILGYSYYPDGHLPEEAMEFNLVVDEEIDLTQFYVVSKSLVKKPLKPSEHHVFDYTIKDWIDPRTPETEWHLIRHKRDMLLENCDWTQLPDVPLLTKEMWVVYRQALRDITNQPDPFNIVWPESPT